MNLLTAPIIVVGIIVLYLLNSIKILREYERGVIFRLGRLLPQPKGPGLIFVFSPIDRIVRISLRLITMDIPPQDVITKDNVTVKVNAVLYFRVIDPLKCVIEVQDYIYATSQLAQTTLRSLLGQVPLDDLLSEREKLNSRLQEIIEQHTDPWGIKVQLVEMKQVDLPENMQRAIAKQAEAERERRAKVIHADGEFQAADKLTQAADIISRNPQALQLRFLGTLTDIAAEKNSTIVFPLPLELLRAFSYDKNPEKKQADEK
jgi:regulator of protease activity HflC (stomatin/prohibitin superfamily)